VTNTTSYLQHRIRHTTGEFFEAVVRVALLKHQRRMSPGACVERLLHDNVIPYALAAAPSDVRVQLLNEDVHRVFKAYIVRIHALFLAYCARDTDDTSVGASLALNTAEFELLLMQHNLIDEKSTMKDCLSAFALSQIDVVANGDQVGAITHVASVNHNVPCICCQTLTLYYFLRFLHYITSVRCMPWFSRSSSNF
jgi:hypothetical protein